MPAPPTRSKQKHNNLSPLITPFVGRAEIVNHDLEAGDDVVHQERYVGEARVRQRILDNPWLNPFLEKWYPGRSDSPFVNAWAALWRIVVTAGVLDCTHSRNLSRILGLPEAFVLGVLPFLRAADWKDTILCDIRHFVEVSAEDPDQLVCMVDEFMMKCTREKFGLLHMLRATGWAL